MKHKPEEVLSICPLCEAPPGFHIAGCSALHNHPNGPFPSYVPGWTHDTLCESENVHGYDTPCWCEERFLNNG